MKINLHHSLLVFCLLTTPVGLQYAHAQEGGYPNPDAFEEVEPSRDKVANSPGEVDPSDNRASVGSVKDTSGPSTAATTTNRIKQAEATNDRAIESNDSSRAGAEDDDSLLTFNFLYYLFEKYKLQDIVDQ
jgi:hypothetical protein